MTSQAEPKGAPVAAQGSPRWWRKFGKATSELDAEELRGRAESLGATQIVDCPVGEPSVVAGVLRAVTLRPREGVPAVVAELYDGSGSMHLVWLGRRRIVGIDPGRVLSAEGRMNMREGNRVMFNPRYWLLRGADE